MCVHSQPLSPCPGGVCPCEPWGLGRQSGGQFCSSVSGDVVLNFTWLSQACCQAFNHPESGLGHAVPCNLEGQRRSVRGGDGCPVGVGDIVCPLTRILRPVHLSFSVPFPPILGSGLQGRTLVAVSTPPLPHLSWCHPQALLRVHIVGSCQVLLVLLRVPGRFSLPTPSTADSDPRLVPLLRVLPVLWAWRQVGDTPRPLADGQPPGAVGVGSFPR